MLVHQEIRAIQNVRGQNDLAFSMAELSVGNRQLHRYREAQRYKETGRYAGRYGVGAQVTDQYCYNKATGRIEGSGNLDGIAPPAGTVTFLNGGTVADISVSGDAHVRMPVCDRPGGGGDRGQGAGHGRKWRDYPGGYSCKVRPPRCFCHVIGGNSLNQAAFPNGIASAAFGNITLDSGDASFFVPYYMHIVAFEVGDDADAAITGGVLPALLQDSTSGREPNLRRASDTDQSFGILTTVYGQDKMIECVDWNRFASINNQQLTLRFYNPNTVGIHVFVDLWGLPAA